MSKTNSKKTNSKKMSSKNLNYQSLEKINDDLIFDYKNSICLSSKHINNTLRYERYLLGDGSLFEGNTVEYKNTQKRIPHGFGNFFMKTFLDPKYDICYNIYSGEFNMGKYHGYGKYYINDFKRKRVLVKNTKFNNDSYFGVTTTLELNLNSEQYQKLCDEYINDNNYKLGEQQKIIKKLLSEVDSKGILRIDKISQFDKNGNEKEINYMVKDNDHNDTTTYIGTFDKKNFPNGYGKITIGCKTNNIKVEDETFVGSFVNGEMRKGKYTTKKYSIEGEFKEKNDQICFDGSYVMKRPKYSKGFQKVIGTWKNDQLQHPCYLD